MLDSLQMFHELLVSLRNSPARCWRQRGDSAQGQDRKSNDTMILEWVVRSCWFFVSIGIKKIDFESCWFFILGYVLLHNDTILQQTRDNERLIVLAQIDKRGE